MTIERSNRWRSSIFSSVIAGMIFLPVFLAEVYAGTKGDSDFPLHLRYILDMQSGRPIPAFIVAHSAWQFLLLAFHAIFGTPFQSAELISILLCIAVTAGLLCWWAWPVMEKANLRLWQAVTIIAGINLAAPIALFWFLDQQLYLGYVGIVSYHNPTIILLRPLAILQFVYALRGLAAVPVSRMHILAAALISVLATFTKPNFALCLIPAILLIASYKMIQKQATNLALLLFGLLIPMIVLLVWQFWVTYQGDDSAHVIFSPLGAMSVYSDYLLPKFILSIPFPLLVTALYWKQASRHLPLILAWAIFIFGAFFTYFIAESGSRFKDGNFTWSGEIALFVLFAVSTFFFLEIQKNRGIKQWVTQMAWIGHILLGVVGYIYFTLHILYLV